MDTSVSLPVAATIAAQGWDLYLPLFGHFLVLSLLAIGGAIATAPEMHRFSVEQHGWITDAQFGASIALAQASPGPNVLFVAVVGWHVAGLAGACVAMAGMLLPSTVLAVAVGRWGRRRADHPGVRAAVAGLAPLTLGLILAGAWVLIEPVSHRPGPVLLAVGAALLLWRTRISPLWLIAIGAGVGALGGA
jgi:chromate transporter